MLYGDEGESSTSYATIGGLGDQLRELREVIELPLVNPELFVRVGIKPPKGVLLYGPPGTGKTLVAKAIASNIEAKFLKVVASAIVDKYIGESARLIREMFGYAREHQPCVIFMDEVDAIGGRRFSEGTSADREIQRTLMELLNQLDGFDQLHGVKMIMATNRPDVIDPALLRPGRLDRKIEIPLPNAQSRIEILKIHASKLTKKEGEGFEIDYEAIIKLADGFNGADLRNICTEGGESYFSPFVREPTNLPSCARCPRPSPRAACVPNVCACRAVGMMAIRDEREYVIHEDFMKAVRKMMEQKKLETKMDYQKP
jgi:26S proteasome regulatory subunit T4